MKLTTDLIIGTNVRILRERYGWSQAEVALRFKDAGLPGWHPQTITRLEQGARSIKLREAPSIAAVLGTSMEELCDSGTALTELRKKLIQDRAELEARWVELGGEDIP